jgi:CheY-like chemotaxis protein
MIISQPSVASLMGHPRSSAAQFAALLHEFYEDLLDQGVPERLAALVRQMPETPHNPSSDERRIALVAEGDDDARSLAATLLEETDLCVVECTSAEAALRVLETKGERVAFVFADEALPGAGGARDLARSVATLWPHVHVVVTLSRDVPRDQLPAGVVALRKPWRGLDVLMAAERAAAAQ